MMKGFLERKPAGKAVWPGTWKERTNVMVARDLAAAKAAWVNEGGTATEKKGRARADRLNYADAGGRFFDFHSLRHQFISDLARAGVHPKVAQELARHSDIRLIMNTYTHLGLADAVGALERLPARDSVRTPFATFSGETCPVASPRGQEEKGKKTA
jgi:integrase